MFEATMSWTMPTAKGIKQTWDEIREDPELSAVFETGHVKISACCMGCNVPGGGGHSDTAKPPEDHWSTGQTPCGQSDTEKRRCPLMRDTMRDVLHFGEKCHRLHCETCTRRGQVGRMRVNDLVTVHAKRVVSVPGPGGQVAHTFQGYCFVGRYLGMDKAGHAMRFELMELGKGPSGLRGWLTQDGTFIEDITEDVRRQLETGPAPVKGKIKTASSVAEAERQAKRPGRNDPCPCNSGEKYKNCHGRKPN